MARGIASAINQAIREGQREAKRQQAQAVRNAKAEQKRLAAMEKAALIDSRERQVQLLNTELSQSREEIDGILGATLGVDDYFNLKELYRDAVHPDFECPEFEPPIPTPTPTPVPPEPVYRKPPFWKPLLGKRRYEIAEAKAVELYTEAQAQWRLRLEATTKLDEELRAGHEQAERQRIANLEQARAAYNEQCNEREQQVKTFNSQIDKMIANLSYGDKQAVEAYFTIVFARSRYPEIFKVSHEMNFEPSTAELTLRVSVPPPCEMCTKKAYRYVKTRDKIVHSELSQKAMRDRYTSAVHQVALRSIHEAFEADRRGIVKTIAIEVGTTFAAPATGIVGFMPFVAVAAERETFVSFSLSDIVPRKTLDYLGASLSKNPFGLESAVTTGVRTA